MLRCTYNAKKNAGIIIIEPYIIQHTCAIALLMASVLCIACWAEWWFKWNTRTPWINNTNNGKALIVSIVIFKTLFHMKKGISSGVNAIIILVLCKVNCSLFSQLLFIPH